MKNAIIQNLEQLINEGSSVLLQTNDCKKAEPIFIKILNLIKGHINYRFEFSRILLNILKSGNGSWEIVQFCMRELKWPEIKIYAQEEIKLQMCGEQDWRVISIMDNILAVYQTTWDDSDLYDYYSID